MAEIPTSTSDILSSSATADVSSQNKAIVSKAIAPQTIAPEAKVLDSSTPPLAQGESRAQLAMDVKDSVRLNALGG